MERQASVFSLARAQLDEVREVPRLLTPLMWHAIGMRKGYGTVAYYEWRLLDDLTSEYRSALLTVIGGSSRMEQDLERWLREPDRTVGDVRDLLEAAEKVRPGLRAPPITLRPGLVHIPKIARARLPRAVGVALESLRQREDHPSVARLLTEACTGAEFGALTSSQWLERLDHLIEVAGVQNHWSEDEIVSDLMDFWRSEASSLDVHPNQSYRLGRFLELIAQRLVTDVSEIHDDALTMFLRSTKAA